jgi:hypothetical protein
MKVAPIKLRIPFPWIGVYYSPGYDEMRRGRKCLCFWWGKEFCAVFFRIGVYPFFNETDT